VITELKKDYNVTLFFYNPNVHPAEEYDKRLGEAKKIAKLLKVPLIEGDYDTKKWLDAVKGHEDDKEGGKRCEICFRVRLEETARLAKEKGFDLFTTTLTVSPYKNADVINKIGKELEKYNVKFLSADFKKKDGYRKSIELSKEHKLYRQHYCGCIYSKQK
tara:strand:- start:3962 stop:4444 length:483 start_codon:yes stop_codon:yes gene_type:complete